MMHEYVNTNYGRNVQPFNGYYIMHATNMGTSLLSANLISERMEVVYKKVLLVIITKNQDTFLVSTEERMRRPLLQKTRLILMT